MPKEPMTTMSFHLPETWREHLRHVALARGQTMTALLKLAIAEAYPMRKAGERRWPNPMRRHRAWVERQNDEDRLLDECLARGENTGC